MTSPVIAKDRTTWAPHAGSQALFLSCPIYEALYEGTRGPGKTDALLMDFAQHTGQGFGEHWRGILFRRTYKQLADVVAKSKRWFRPIFPGATFNKQDYTWRWPDGEELLFRYLARPDDYWNYHGHEYPWIGWEELTNWPDLVCYHAMKSCSRSSHPGMPRKYRSTCNPYGVGHNAVKLYLIDPAPAGVPFQPPTIDLPDEAGLPASEERLLAVRITGHYSENRTLLAADPTYPQKIAAAAANPEQAKAWLHGSWDIVAGGMFDDVWKRDRIVLEPFPVPSTWRIDRSYDWGASKPFSVGWWAEHNGEGHVPGCNCPRGSLFRIGEWYGWDGKTPNVGLRMTDKKIAQGIREREEAMGIAKRVRPGPADTMIFHADPGRKTIADIMRQDGIRFIEADKKPGSRKPGWSRMREMLEAARDRNPETPHLHVFTHCRQFIRTVPTLPRSDKDPDDVDTEAEDHCLHGDTLVDTLAGPRRIRDMVGTEGVVLSVGGRWERYAACRRTRRGAAVVRVALRGGRSITCTGDHKIMLLNGEWVEAARLLPGTVLHGVDHPRPLSCGTVLSGTQHTGGWNAGSSHQRDGAGVPRPEILPLRQVFPTEGRAPAPGRVASAQRADSGWLPRASRHGGPGPESDRGLGAQAGRATPRRSHAATGARPEEPQEHRRCPGRRGTVAPERRRPRVAPKALRGPRQAHRRTEGDEGVRALREGIPDGPHHGDNREVLLEQLQVGGTSDVGHRRRGENLRGVRRDVRGQQVLDKPRLLACVRPGAAPPPIVERVEEAGTADVYCLAVPATGAFAVEGGIIVHNCADETRYRITAPKREATVTEFRI